MNSNWHLPKRVTIELTNRCNRSCQGCPRHKMTYPLGDMKLTLFTDIIQQLPDYTCIVPFFRGESTLHKQFPECMQQLKRFREVQFATNGDFLTGPNKKAILDNCTFLSLSLHEFKLPQETKWLQFLYDCLGADIETQVSIVDSEVDDKRRSQFVREWSNHVSRVRIYAMHSLSGFGSLNTQTTVKACNKPFEDTVVYWDGKVGLCNHDWNNQTVIGDLTTHSLENIWNSSEYQAIREKHNHGCRYEVASCKDCSFEPNHVYGEVIKNG